MTLRNRLTEEMKAALKARDDLRLSAIRMIRAAASNREIELKRELGDPEIQEIIATLVKQRREAIRLFQEGGRQDLVAKEERELSILLGFLPQQLNREEVRALVVQAIAASGAQGSKDLGSVMKLVMPQVAGRADGKLVNEVVRELLP